MSEKLDLIEQLFRTLYRLNMNDQIEYSDEVFWDIIDELKKLPSFDMDNNIVLELKKRIDSEFQIYQKDGLALVDEYMHDNDWYKVAKEKIDFKFWERYKKHLFDKKWPINVLEHLDKRTLDDIMGYLGNPNTDEPFSRKGLVMGDVQSGKTSNYIGLISKAVDSGYKVVILLTGTIESLRRQTQIRVEEGFIGYDADARKHVGVGVDKRFNIIPKSVTSRVNDFIGISGENTMMHIDNDNVPFIFITKKNSKILQKIRVTLTNINIKPPQKQINTSLLVIDDEADNASVNTNKKGEDPTTINREIRRLLDLFTKSNYVGFTATPFANVFIDSENHDEMLKGDLFPKDFIYSLMPPNNYFGAEKMFLNSNYNVVELINDDTTIFPLKHKKEWHEDFLFPSLIEAINTFLLANAIRDISEKENKNSHRSMLINVSRFINVQEHIKFLVHSELEKIKNAIKNTQKLSKDRYLKNSRIKLLYELYQKHYADFYSWEIVFEYLFDSVEPIKVFKVPSKKEQLNYIDNSDTGVRAIAVGGLSLSRGLTLEGLMISYLYRNTSTFDVLMQMGRFFGYRDKPINYEKLCKVWMLKNTKDYFKEITLSIKQLKEDFVKMVDSNKNPADFGIRVRNESDKLNITSRSKMRTAKKVIHDIDLMNRVIETPFISLLENDIVNNIKCVDKLVQKINFRKIKNRMFASDVSANQIIEFLEGFNIHEANRLTYFDKENIIKFIDNNKYDEFDIIIIGGKGKDLKYNDQSVKSVLRSFDIPMINIARISGTHRRLGGTGDFSTGLDKNKLEEFGLTKQVSNEKYLIQGRNPILAIYPLQLKKESKDYHSYDYAEIEKQEAIFSKNDKNVLYGLGIGFTQNNYYSPMKETTYYINETTKWYECMNDESSEEDE